MAAARGPVGEVAALLICGQGTGATDGSGSGSASASGPAMAVLLVALAALTEGISGSPCRRSGRVEPGGSSCPTTLAARC